MLQIRKKVLLFLLLVSGSAANLFGQLTTSSTMTPVQLVQSVLLGAGVTATNITFTGAPLSKGTFNGATSNIGLNAGVILSSGDISNAAGPNNASSISVANGLPGDPDLDIIMDPTLSYDAAILEFDFIPTSDTIKFRYVFGSEEYMEYVSTWVGGINDGFGFFISGPGISGPFSNNAKNIALIPGTTLPVTMFNLNLNSNGAYYFDNGDGWGTGTAPDGATVQYDGFTVPLTAVAAVQCGSVYHIKLAVADGGDGIIDSGVFLEEGSFASSGNVFITPSTLFGGIAGANDTTIYEGCGSAQVLFDRGLTGSSNPDTIIVSFSGTSDNGLDYSFVSDSIFFAAGQDSAYVTVLTLPDALLEGMETVVLSLYNSTPCNGSDTMSLTLYIIDSPPLTLTMSNDTVINCPTQNIPITITANGGVPIGNYHYSWTNNSSTGDSIQVSPAVTTTYYATVTDTCGNSATDSMKVTIVPYLPLQMTLTDDASYCEGLSAFLDANVTNGRPDYMYNWNPDITLLDTITVTPAVTTSYSLTVTDGCGYTVSDSLTITIVPISTDFTYVFSTNQNAQFYDQSDGAITHFWNFGDASQDSVSTLPNPEHEYINDGVYTVTHITTNEQGCADTISQTITVLPDFYFYFPNSFSPNGNGLNDVFHGYGVGIKSFHMQVFDRWGELLFSTTDLLTGWDGTYKGKLVPPGIYVCVFDLEGFHYELKQYVTNINLIR
ncbi:MAG TPA: choice-of-anchor L domain-containing protein [Bacteroidia bacterium]|jgi:gliding motility-associated-like protein